MASDGSRGPRPFTQRHARTIFVRVPAADWPLVKRGFKTEFRGQIGGQSALFNTPTPSPVVAYSIVRGNYDARLMFLEHVSQEELGAVTEESLQREGFTDFESYRRYWITRDGKKFRPSKLVFVYRIRPWGPGDDEAMAAELLSRLYGEWLP